MNDLDDILEQKKAQLKNSRKKAAEPSPSTTEHQQVLVATPPIDDHRTVSQSNALTSSRRDLDLIEQRCLYQIIWKVRNDYVERGDVQRNLWNNMCITLTPKQLGEVGGDNHRQATFNSLKKLRDKYIEVEDDNLWFAVGLINYAKYDKKANLYEIEVSRLLMPYLVELAEQFTTYQLSVVMALKSKYSQRLYELCCEYKNMKDRRFFLDIKNLRDLLRLGQRYRLYSGFKEKVLDVAKKELKNLFEQGRCDLWFDYYEDEATKIRKAYTRIWFQIHTKTDSEQREQELADMFNQRLWIHKFLIATFKRDKKYIKRVIDALNREPNLIAPIFSRLYRMEREEDKSSYAPLTRYILKNDFKLT